MLEWQSDLKIRNTSLYLDSRTPRGRCFVSHAHSDHIAAHIEGLMTPMTAELAGARVTFEKIVPLDYGQPFSFDPDTSLRLLPAGHVLGSAMIHVTRPEGTLLYTGDFKLRSGLTAPEAQPCTADILVMESTYGQPFFRFPPAAVVAGQLVELVTGALKAGRQPIVMGYSLGKAQEIVRILTDAGIVVTAHGAVAAVCRAYERLGMKVGPVRTYHFDDFHGPHALDLSERGALVAPPQVARSGFVTRFKNPLRIVLTGWAMLTNATYRYGVDHALPLSDHADFDELLELVDRVAPKKIYTHHGYREFAGILQARGRDALPARPDAQMTLFG